MPDPWKVAKDYTERSADRVSNQYSPETRPIVEQTIGAGLSLRTECKLRRIRGH